MNKLINALTLIVVGGLVFACGAKKEDDHGHSHDTEAKEWKQMDDFHMVMAETFHPFKDSANLEPVKSRANELASSAESWSKAELPEKVDNDEMKEKLERLRTETSTLASAVTGGDDKVIGEQLTKVHDLFHEIQEVWYGGESHEHH
ncbi:MAG TPA: hypothetical protein VGD40_13490 [Chryseosolibacter sp.]